MYDQVQLLNNFIAGFKYNLSEMASKYLSKNHAFFQGHPSKAL